ncbi:LLM class flavin-dependent oxidoreductase [Williamsia serinedens]|uniref:Flavin-dependent oxidoreductase, luciferase family (Includes alkanesulfonate monooxygenase SsuD and methylene tetrahydromethanopterin reductase) n=1 Tax=Williamsia serinedens TaxID=391736 RepID=A0ABT1H4K4_9NOCA|nr:LLM class flavin-dependent oxidoreductase [Williamsia serinedens]MCP2162171.1 Flavin-dependent oxidoreductase, luciferase family (includes alkanesulfonate monooxygenase SsuD and methylene tetrahydromethanopterin reductase) [Williamsia serinedens]
MVSFGFMTPPQNAGYAEIARVWTEADAIPEIEHAWLFDHLMPIGGDLDGPIFEGWTLLAALAAQTRRLRLGLLVTSNRIRPPALLAKIATTVDVVSDGRLDFGIGVGSRPGVPWARREYDAFGLPYVETPEAITALREGLPTIRRIWTEDTPFDVAGEVVRVTGAFQNPKPVQAQGPPIMVGGRSSAVLRIAAEHAELWNIPGGDLDDAISRSRLLDRYCIEADRDPAAVTRSIHLGVSLDHPDDTRTAIDAAIHAGFTHVVLGLGAPYREGVAEWLAQELIRPFR